MDWTSIIGSTLAEAAIRIIGVLAVGGAIGVIGTLLWGKGGRKRLVTEQAELKKQVAALEARLALPSSVNIAGRDLTITNMAKGEPIRPPPGAMGPLTESPSTTIGRIDREVIHLGTKHGTMTVSLQGGKATQEDLLRWLFQKKLFAPLDD